MSSKSIDVLARSNAACGCFAMASEKPGSRTHIMADMDRSTSAGSLWARLSCRQKCQATASSWSRSKRTADTTDLPVPPSPVNQKGVWRALLLFSASAEAAWPCKGCCAYCHR